MFPHESFFLLPFLAQLIGIDLLLSLYAIAAFLFIGLGLTALILFTRAKFVSSDMCTIKINNDDSLTIHTEGGQTLLTALTSHGIPIPSPCGGKATCKQCKVKIVEGASPPLQTDIDTFSKKQLQGRMAPLLPIESERRSPCRCRRARSWSQRMDGNCDQQSQCRDLYQRTCC